MAAGVQGILSGLRAKLARHRRVAIAGVVLFVAVLGFVAIHGLTDDIHLKDVRHAFDRLRPDQIGWAIGLTALSYLALTFYDSIALRIVGHPLPWRTAAIASFTSYTISHNLGLAALTGGSARYRVYSRAGLDEAGVARIVLLAGVTFWTGIAAVAGIGLAIRPGALPMFGWTVPDGAARAGGIAVVVALAAIVVARRRGGSIALFGWHMPMPDWRQALALLAVSTVDLAAASAALFVLLPGASPALFPMLFVAYAIAIVVALISHVPGGLGVFEAVIIAALPGNDADVLAALLAYRVIYYVIPLIVAAMVMAIHEGRQWRSSALARVPLRLALPLAPLLLGVLTFLSGAMLLVSGSLPAAKDRMAALVAVEPLPIAEIAHLSASMVGAMLLLVALGLYRRLDGAAWAARILLVVGAVLSIAKGLDYEEASVLLLTAALLQWTRAAFYRRTRLVAEPLSAEWIACVGAAVGLSVMIGFFAYRRIPYSDDLWIEFARNANASRFLRASLAVGLLLAGAAVARLFSAASVQLEFETLPGPIADAALADTDRTDAMLAFTGDKRFLVSESGDAFLMYQVRGSSWIVMGDPVGPEEAWTELLWAIRARADAAQGRVLLYQIGLRAVPAAIELGLKLVKYGEEANVDLARFDLDTPDLRSLRKAARVAERAGADFAVIPAADIPAILPELRAISDAWLADKGQEEKAFSVGRFDEAYLARFDCAVVRVEGRIVAFANIWALPNGHELSIDLMRHAAAMPNGGMDFLFSRLMLWGKARGFQRFALGMAPLSGIEARRLSPAWSKLAHFLFRHGESLYGFEGLRNYKAKFRPDWSPRYIASPGGASLVRGLVDLQRLIGKVHG